MTTLSDARFESLRASAYTGATSDMLLQWLQAEGATSSQVADAWMEFLETKNFGASDGYARNDGWYAYLGSLGYSGSLSDRELQFWVNRVP